MKALTYSGAGVSTRSYPSGVRRSTRYAVPDAPACCGGEPTRMDAPRGSAMRTYRILFAGPGLAGRHTTITQLYNLCPAAARARIGPVSSPPTWSIEAVLQYADADVAFSLFATPGALYDSPLYEQAAAAADGFVFVIDSQFGRLEASTEQITRNIDEWHAIENAHNIHLRKAAEEGRAPDHRTKSDPGLENEIATWGPAGAADVIFEAAVGDALELDSRERQARLRSAPVSGCARHGASRVSG